MHDSYIHRFERYLSSFLTNLNSPSQELNNAILYMLGNGGKRLRPLLCYHLAKALNVSFDLVDSIALSIELLHTYSLIHDDLPAMDNDDFRRGKPSCHKAFNEAVAILAGDGLQALAYEVLLENSAKHLDSHLAIQVTLELLKASGVHGMVAGQALDLSELSKNTVIESCLNTIHELKTGKLFLACVHMLTIASECSDDVAKPLIEFSKHLGFVFQLQDDYLDAYSNNNVLGKDRKSDEHNQKFTYATFLSKELLSDKIIHHYSQIYQLLNETHLDVSGLLSLVGMMQSRTHGTLEHENIE